MGDGMSRFQGWDDAFQTGAKMESRQRLGIGDGNVFNAARIMQPGMLGPNARIVKTGGNGMGFLYLAIGIL
jgi:hypothetical protein